MTTTEDTTYTIRSIVRGGKAGPWHAMNTASGLGLAMCGSRMTGFNFRQLRDVTKAVFLSGSLTERQCPGCKTAVKAGRGRGYHR